MKFEILIGISPGTDVRAHVGFADGSSALSRTFALSLNFSSRLGSYPEYFLKVHKRLSTLPTIVENTEVRTEKIIAARRNNRIDLSMHL